VEDEQKFNKIRQDKERRKNYLSTLSAKYNPDILAGAAFGGKNQGFVRGN